MVHTRIRHCIDLLIYLVDTTTGSTISGKNVLLFQDNTKIEAMKKETGMYILCNYGRNNFVLTIESLGYESTRYAVNYEMLDERIPTIYVQMIPKITIENDTVLSELKGNLPGLEKIDAVTAEDESLYLNRFDKQTQTITLFNYLEKPICNIEYGVISPEKTEYEVLTVIRTLSKNQFEIYSALQKYYEPNSLISRVICGKVESNGDYILRMRKKDSRQKYIIRYIVHGTERFERR